MHNCGITEEDLLNPSADTDRLAFLAGSTMITLATTSLANPFVAAAPDIASCIELNGAILGDSCVASVLAMRWWLRWSWTAYDAAEAADQIGWPDVDMAEASAKSPETAVVIATVADVFHRFPVAPASALLVLHLAWHPAHIDARDKEAVEDYRMGLLFAMLRVASITLNSVVELRGSESLASSIDALDKLAKSDNVSDLLR